jgi:hypothetical protein
MRPDLDIDYYEASSAECAEPPKVSNRRRCGKLGIVGQCLSWVKGGS